MKFNIKIFFSAMLIYFLFESYKAAFVDYDVSILLRNIGLAAATLITLLNPPAFDEKLTFSPSWDQLNLYLFGRYSWIYTPVLIGSFLLFFVSFFI